MSAPIFLRAPLHVRYSRNYLFEPKLVSIGPLYYEKLKEQTVIQKAKEECKLYFARIKLASTSSTSNPIIDDLIQQFNDLVHQQLYISEMKARSHEWYSNKFGLIENEFFEMLVSDCLFIIRILLAFSREGEEFMFCPELDINILRSDLLLIENQIPFFFLKSVYKFLWAPLPASEHSPVSNFNSPTSPQGQNQTNTQLPDSQFLQELRPFIWSDMPWKFNEHATLTDPKHLLDLYWRWCLPSHLEGLVINAQNRTPDNGVQASWEKIYARRNAPKRIKNAHELYLTAGVTFQKRKHSEGFGVTFQNGILQIPHLQLDQNQITLLANLVAFEESKPSTEQLLTSYVLLVDGLLSTKKDVELLQRIGLITNKLSRTQMALTCFSDIGNFCPVNNDYYCQHLFDDLNSYYSSIWKRQIVKYQRTYTENPWAAHSFIAGVSVLWLALIQTVFTFYSFFHPGH